MLTNRLRKIGSDFAVLFSAVPRRDMSSLGFRNSVMEKESPYETFNVLRLIVLWQLYSSLLFHFFILNLGFFYLRLIFLRLHRTFSSFVSISRYLFLYIYILLVQEEDCTMREAQRGQSLPIRQEDSKFEILSR
ncbi:hypothetical protein ACJX0J_001803 [Zea mays]